MHLGFLFLFGRRVDDVFAVNQTDNNAADGAIPGNIRDGQGDGGRDHGGDLGRAVRIHAHDGAHYGHVIAHILGEERADGAVDHAAGQDGLFARTGFAALIGAGNVTDRIQLFLIIHRKREEIHSFTRLGRHGYRPQNHGVAITHEAGAVGQLRDLSGFDHKGTSGQSRFEHFVIFEHTKSSVSYRILQNI